MASKRHSEYTETIRVKYSTMSYVKMEMEVLQTWRFTSSIIVIFILP